MFREAGNDWIDVDYEIPREMISQIAYISGLSRAVPMPVKFCGSHSSTSSMTFLVVQLLPCRTIRTKT